MPDDAMAAAQAAALEARAAVTQIFAHIRDCERRYQDSTVQMQRMNDKLDTLIEQGGFSRGRSSATLTLFGGIPNAIWSVVMSLAFGAVGTFLAMQYIKTHP